MPGNSTTNWWSFPPLTCEVQFDEKWAFVGKKAKNCDPDNSDDDFQGDCWDHVALDPVSRLVISVVVGRRAPELTHLLVEDFYRRTGGRLMNLMTSDEYPAYAPAIAAVYGKEVTPEPTGKPGRPRGPYQAVPEELQYATVHKTRESNRVVAIETRVVYGTEAGVAQALEQSEVSSKVNTVYVERQNGTDRNRNARKVRKTYCFSKDWEVHAAQTYFTMYSYNFCWPVRTLRQKDAQGKWQPRTPAMAAGLADHVWTLEEWVTLPSARQRS
jgi:IS1 family transposase